MADIVLFVVFPYLAAVLAIGGSIWRYSSDRFSFSSLSSQFLENRALFWGSVPWHYGVIAILIAHVLAALFPGLWGDLLGDRTRLYVMEVTGFALAAMLIVGLVVLIVRRLGNSRALTVTSPMDWVLLAVLLLQVSLGFWIAVVYRWGGSWYLQTAVPWLYSLATFNPQIQTVTVLPWEARLHFLNGFLVIALFPFTRLVHMATYPITYLWRPYQVVIWNRKQSAATRRQ